MDREGIDQPNCMKLIIYFYGLGAFRNEVFDFDLVSVSSFKTRRIMEDKLGVAGTDEWTIDVVDSALTKI